MFNLIEIIIKLSKFYIKKYIFSKEKKIKKKKNPKILKNSIFIHI